MSTTRPYHSAPVLQSPQPSPPASDITKTAMEDFKHLFDMFDISRNGTITTIQFRDIARMLGECPSGPTLDRMLRAACEIPPTAPVPSTLSFDHFMRFFALYQHGWPTHVSERDIFEVLDQDAGGTVTPAELERVLNRFGMRVTEDEAVAMADFATPFPGSTDIGLADIAAVADRVKALREKHVMGTDTSDTEEDDSMTGV